jgi:hypothetical protein
VLRATCTTRCNKKAIEGENIAERTASNGIGMSRADGNA